jgi:death on curing protein
MLPIPQEMLEEMGLGVGQDMILTSEGEGMRVEPSAPRSSPDATELMALFTKKYEEATRNLAHR